MDFNDNKKYLSIQDVADMFNLKNKKTVDNWLYTGTLPRNLTVKLGRHVFFVRAKLEEFIENKSNQ